MFRKLFREFYLLPRGEQRAMVLLSLLLIISLGARIAVQMLPAREDPGLDQFVEESRQILAALAEADSLARAGSKDTSYRRTHSPVFSTSDTIPGPAFRLTGGHYIPYRSLRENPIDINTADSTGLLPLPGIGPVLAGRIIKYRNLLGGFLDENQLTEIYGLTEETLERITPFICVDTTRIGKLHINYADFRTLLRHPYLEYEDVKAIMKYRDVMGQISAIQDIWQNFLLPDSTLDRIEPYLDLSKD